MGNKTVAAALQGVSRMLFAMAVSPDHLLAATVVASVAKEYGKLEALVDLSQMTVSQMTATSTAEIDRHHVGVLSLQGQDMKDALVDLFIGARRVLDDEAALVI